MNKKSKRGIILLLLIALILCFSSYLYAGDNAVSEKHSANISWILISSALVLLMVPGLAFFYGGMVRSKNVLNTLMLSFISLGVITIQWVIMGYSLAFGSDWEQIIGWDWNYILLYGINHTELKGEIPHLAFMVFQGMFAVITPALISGAIAERMKFGVYVLFIVLWSTLVYDPICHWVWGGGWIQKLGKVLGWGEISALDFAGGTVVHISSGVSALAAVLILGKRSGYPQEVISPNNLNFTLLGAGLPWFGWFGFNAGSALAANESATLAFVTTFVATAGGAVAWALVEKLHRGKTSALGVASGIVAGLVAITPAAGFVKPFWALVIGFFAGFICYGGILLKGKFGYDDALDVLGIHGIGGTWGAIATGVFATIGAEGLIIGNFKQFIIQIIAVIGTIIYAFIVTWIIVKILDKIIGIRVKVDVERIGLDQDQHGETAYNI